MEKFVKNYLSSLKLGKAKRSRGPIFINLSKE